jgi:hypothetical protein
MHYLSSLYLITAPLHVSGPFVAHHEEAVSVYVANGIGVSSKWSVCELGWKGPPTDHLRLIHTYHAVPMSRPCRAAKCLDCVIPIWFTQCGRVWFTHAMPQPCRSESDFSRPRHSAAWEYHGMCESASAVQRRHVGDLPAFGFFRLPRGVRRRLLSEAYQIR